MLAWHLVCVTPGKALRLAHRCLELLVLAARKLAHGTPAASALWPGLWLPPDPSTRTSAGGTYASGKVPPGYNADGAQAGKEIEEGAGIMKSRRDRPDAVGHQDKAGTQMLKAPQPGGMNHQNQFHVIQMGMAASARRRSAARASWLRSRTDTS